MTYLGDAAGELSLDQLRYHGLLPANPTRKDTMSTTAITDMTLTEQRVLERSSWPCGTSVYPSTPAAGARRSPAPAAACQTPSRRAPSSTSATRTSRTASYARTATSSSRSRQTATGSTAGYVVCLPCGERRGLSDEYRLP